jgi:hypothetical protein
VRRGLSGGGGGVSGTTLSSFYTTIPLTATSSNATTSFLTVGCIPSGAFTEAQFPATIGALTRQIRLRGTILSSVATYTSTVKLYSFEDAAFVISSITDNSAASPTTNPTSFDVLLTTGTTSGTIRTDVDRTYYLQMATSNATSTSLIYNAHIVIRYV